MKRVLASCVGLCTAASLAACQEATTRVSVGFLFAGLSQASIPTSAGGTLLVGHQILWLPVPLISREPR